MLSDARTAGPGLPFSRKLAATVRAEQWWSFKLIPPLVLVYAGCVARGVPVHAQWPMLLVLLLALASGATGVSVLNDLADRRDDASAGKLNRMAQRPGRGVLLLGLSAASAAVVLWCWRDRPLLLCAYLAAWLAFLLYSLPPVRLKARGFWGVAADATGAHLLPALMAALCLPAAGNDATWLVAVALWSWALGVRGIVGHQLEDREADARAGTDTFVTRTSRAHAVGLVRTVIFPLELVALAVLLLRIGAVLPWLALAAYLLMLRAKVVLFRIVPIIVESRPRCASVMQDYYLVFLPLALLGTAVWTHRGDLAVIALHLGCFAPVNAVVAIDIVRLVARRIGVSVPP